MPNNDIIMYLNRISKHEFEYIFVDNYGITM